MTESHSEEAKQLLSHGWSVSNVSQFLALREYKQRWGGANLDREERLFLRKAESVLLQAGLGPSRQEGGSSSLRRSSGATTSQLPAISNSSSFVALDFETANYSRDSACSLAIIRVESLKVVSRTYRLIKPPSSHFMFTDIHGITWRDVKSEPTFKDLWYEFRPLFEGISFIAAHNASFDSSVMKACCETYRLVPPGAPYLCTVKLARQTWQLRPANLPSVCAYLGLHLEHHNALSDAEACANIVRAAAGCKVK
jgi:DNA polymerase III subunit epsilon